MLAFAHQHFRLHLREAWARGGRSARPATPRPAHRPSSAGDCSQGHGRHHRIAPMPLMPMRW